MSFRKLLISVSLLALMAVAALAQDQTSQTPNAQPQPSIFATPAPTENAPGDSSSPSSTDTDAAPTPSGPPPIQEPPDSKVKHDGGEDDVDAIGNRKIG